MCISDEYISYVRFLKIENRFKCAMSTGNNRVQLDIQASKSLMGLSMGVLPVADETWEQMARHAVDN